MTAEANKDLHRRYIEEMNRENFDVLDDYAGPGYVFHGGGG